MRNRGQGIAIDLLLGVTIFLLLLTATLAIWSNSETTATNGLYENEMQQMAERALDRLIRTGGEPANWETLDPDNPAILTVGLAKSDRFLDEEKVNQFVSGKVSLDPLALVALWHLDGDATDSSGKGNNGTVSGATWRSGADCLSGGCLKFDGIDDYMTTATPNSSLNLGGGSFTIATWIKFNSIPTAGKSIYNYYPGSNAGWYTLYKGAADTSPFKQVLHVRAGDTWGGGWGGSQGTQEFEVGPWYFVAGTWNNSTNTLTAYIDGTKDWETIRTPTSWGGTAAAYPFIGRGSATGVDAIDATLDEMHIYNRALSADEIKALYRGLSFDKTKLLIGNNDYYFRVYDPNCPNDQIKNDNDHALETGVKPESLGKEFMQTKVARAVTLQYKRRQGCTNNFEAEKGIHEAIAELTLYTKRR